MGITIPTTDLLNLVLVIYTITHRNSMANTTISIIMNNPPPAAPAMIAIGMLLLSPPEIVQFY